MFLNLLGTLILGVAAVGTVLLAFRVVGRKAPRWLLPAAAGATMLGFQVWSDYTWQDRAASSLPEKVEVVKTYSDGFALAPWTFLFPQVNRLVAVDVASVRRNKKAPDYAMANVYLIARYQRGAKGVQIFDCAQARRADLDPKTKFHENGLPENAAWTAVGKKDRMLKVVCDEK